MSDWQGQPPSIFLAYRGVHQIAQMAIAANEMHQLSRYCCSAINLPGKWGHRLPGLRNSLLANPISSDRLPPEKVVELPLPNALSSVLTRLSFDRRKASWWANRWFEDIAISKLSRLPEKPSIVVGAETCALHLFQSAKSRGMKCMLDCHGIPTVFIDEAIQRAADEFNLPRPSPLDSAEMSEKKALERNLADVLVFCSELQRNIWVQLGVPPEKCQAIPLWVDADYWQRSTPPPTLAKGEPLKVAAVGAGTLSKGLPYLLQAAKRLGDSIQLSLVGRIAEELQPMVGEISTPVHHLPFLSRPQLRDFFSTQHLLVMPSLGDSFGFIAMEAMACGLPVIVTTHTGAPVPNPSWRVPAHDGAAIASRIKDYLDHPEHLPIDSATARAFASQFTPQRYRDQIKETYRELLAS